MKEISDLQRAGSKPQVVRMMRLLLAVAALLPIAGRPVMGQNAPSGGLRPQEVLHTFSGAVKDLSNRVSPAIVQVFVRRYSQPEDFLIPSTQLLSQERTQGSGVLLSQDGYILTNAHVVSRARSIRVRLARPEPDDRSRTSVLQDEGSILPAELVGLDAETDLAVLKADLHEAPFLELGDSEALSKGELVLAFGSPRGLGDSVSMGVVSASARQLRPDDPMRSRLK